ncbi:MAG: hypothetical protein ACM31N_05990 [Deltaproteobacteria bacterium]
MKRVYAWLGGIFLAASLLFALSGHAQSPQDLLGQYVAALKRNPDDYALREKIVRHVQTMSPAPAIPEEAERHMARGAAAVKNAKDVADFRDAVNEFEKATLAAPWLAGAYYNLGIARDKAGMYSDAIRSLKLYLLAEPDADDAKAVKMLIYEIEYRQEKAAKESSPATIAVKKQKEEEDFLKKLDGATYTSYNPHDRRESHTFNIRDGKAFKSSRAPWGSDKDGPYLIEGRRFAGWNYSCFDGRKGRTNCVISETGDRITCTFCEGENPPMVFNRER